MFWAFDIWQSCLLIQAHRASEQGPGEETMQPVHKTLLEVNEEFLVSEAPAAPLLKALLDKDVLTDLDLQQLDNLEAQGERAVKRFVLHVLPLRGPLAYPALLEALQEAEAQHLVDLLLEGEAVLTAAVKPIELPEPSESRRPQEDPNEYARKLRANRALIEEAVEPGLIVPLLLQNGVLTSLEEALLESLQGQHALSWSVLWGVLLQRGQKAYRAFMGTLLQHGYSALFHTIEETRVTGAAAMKSVLSRNVISAADIKARAASEHHHQQHLNNNNSSDADYVPTLPRSAAARDPRMTPPPPPLLGSSSQQSGVSPRSREVVLAARGSGSATRSSNSNNHNNTRSLAGPLRPGHYSLGDMDFLYTPKSEKLMQLTRPGAEAPSPPPPVAQATSTSTDLLYNPAWSDQYNHLRGADCDVDASSPHYPGDYLNDKSSILTVAQEENGAAAVAKPSSSSDSGMTLSDQNHSGKTKGSEPSTARRQAGDAIIKDDLLLAKLEAISEKDTESEVSSHVGDAENARKLSADHPARDRHSPEKGKDDPEDSTKRSSSTLEKTTANKIPGRDPGFSRTLNQKTYRVTGPETKSTTEDNGLHEKE